MARTRGGLALVAAPRGEIRSLMGLRGLAACWVMLGHYELGEWTGNALFQALISRFYLAVDLFLILSGFVLARAYETRIARPGGVRSFLLLRLARIYPLYAATSLVCLVMIWAGLPVWGDPTHTPLALLANALMVQGWWWPNDSLNSPAWSISTEWAANLLFAPLAVLLLRGSAGRAVACAIAAWLCLAGFAFLLGTTPDEQMAAGQIGWYTAPWSVMRCVCTFTLGVAAWRLQSRAPWTARLGEARPMLTLAAACVATSVLTTTPALDLLFVPAACGLVIGCAEERSWLTCALGSAVPYWLGTISFSLYLWHLPLVPLRVAIAGVLSSRGVGLPNLIAVGITMLAALAVSATSYRRLEDPARRWLRRKWDGGSA